MNAPVTPRERPILFSGEMVRQILDGKKTQTRRPIGLSELRPSTTPGYDWTWRGMAPVRSIAQQRRCPDGCWQDVSGERLLSLCPYGAPGDRLWVRETFWSQHDTDTDGYQTIDCGPDLTGPEHHPGWEYCATPACEAPPKPEREQTVAPHEGPPVPGEWWLAPPDDWNGEDDDRERRGTWVFLPWQLYTKHPSIHMPRWASRLTLEVTGVRVERVQDITEEDARAEGCVATTIACEAASGPSAAWSGGGHISARETFASLWRDTYDESWDRNDWVWVVEFRRVEADR